MKISILFDKEAINTDLHTGWGVSFLIDNRVLFDTGENAKRLIDNMKQLGIEMDVIEAIVISHDHWDHTGGLWEILKRRRLKVYGCPNFSEEFKWRVKELNSEFIEVDKLTQVSPAIYISGEISGHYAGAGIAEQAVIIKSERGISVLTGCSHPGIVKILEKIKSEFPGERLYLVAGGFHLIDRDARLIKIMVEEFKKMGVSKVGPTHCTGRKAEDIFKAEYKNDFIPIRVGQTLEV